MADSPNNYDEGTRYLTRAHIDTQQRYQIAIGDSRSSKEIAELEQIMTAVAVMLEARAWERTFH